MASPWRPPRRGRGRRFRGGSERPVFGDFLPSQRLVFGDFLPLQAMSVGQHFNSQANDRDGPQRSRGRGRGRGKRGRGGGRSGGGGDRFRGGETSEPDGDGAQFQGRRNHERSRGNRGRGRGYGSARVEDKAHVNIRSLTLSEIMELSTLSPADLVRRLFNDAKAFQRTLEQQQKLSKPGIMDVLIEILLKIAQCLQGENEAQASQLLAEALSERCSVFHLQLKQHIFALKASVHRLQGVAVSFQPSSGSFSSPPPQTQAQSLCKLFRALLVALPSSSWSCLPIDELLSAIKNSMRNVPEKLVTEAEELVKLRDEIGKSFTEKRQACHVVEEDWDNKEYRGDQILPKWDEICSSTPPSRLRPNIIDGRYTDWMHYYDIHFRLLREDFIAPLRRGVCEFIAGVRGRRLKDVKIYHNVNIIEPVCTRSGICYSLQFDVSRFQHCNWEHSKRLLYGSLLCLSPDHFQNLIFFATVSNRDAKELSEGKLQVQFQEGKNLLPYCQRGTFTMVESLVYFEASKHILCSLQTAEVDTMPFTKYLIENECTSVSPPKYLADKPCPQYNMSCLYGKDSPSPEPEPDRNAKTHSLGASRFFVGSLSESESDSESEHLTEDSADDDALLLRASSLHRHTFNILDVTKWPSSAQAELDTSQLQAIQMALTQEVAVIQGPPGTGKTYIGLKIVEALLSNREVWDPKGDSPILVMCFTNHALDQFLEGIIRNPNLDVKDSEPRSRALGVSKTTTHGKTKATIVHVGGRSQSEIVKEHSIAMKRRRVYIPGDVHSDIRDFEDDREMQIERINTTKSEDNATTYSFVPLSKLEQYMDPDHYYQLLDGVSPLPEVYQQHALELWLELATAFLLQPVIPKADEYDEYPPFEDSHNAPSPLNSSQFPSPRFNKQALNFYPIPHGTGQQALIPNPADPMQLFHPQENVTTLVEQNQAPHSDENKPESSSSSESDDSEADDHSSEEGSTNELIDIQGEASMEQSSRMLDDEYEAFQRLDRPQETPVQHESPFFAFSQPTYPHHSGRSSEETTFEIKNSKDAANHFRWGIAQPPMTDREAEGVNNIQNLHLVDRWQLYKFWVTKYRASLASRNEGYFQNYNRICKLCTEAHQRADRYTLETANVIGMTTTGAAKYQHILHLVKPKIVIVEEAAEVLESHIVSALNAGTQHLILIGDHKQLRPKTNEYNLAKRYKLDVSLFERLVRNGFPRATLEIQHRMRPQIARLVHPHIYDKLINHESVLKYSDVKGVSSNLFFIQHSFPEKEDPNLISHSNPHEASYLAALCKYLLQQGYEPSQITILVTYTGQRLKMRREMPKSVFYGVRLCTVDNFQGEENDIILLSLVRSNPEENVGFLKEDNRVCVALSRAKMGFYCIGNFKMLRNQAPIWEKIMCDMESKGHLGEALPLHCCNHPDTKFTAKSPIDFLKNAPSGGCTKDCTYRLGCGHVCVDKCHIKDPDHLEYQCRKPCTQKCPDGHPCPLQCFEKCLCKVRVIREMPGCGHMQKLVCHEDPSQVKCISSCLKSCKNGHACPHRCWKKPCPPCFQIISKVIPRCGHMQDMPCYKTPELFDCMADCEIKCGNGHPCPKRCHEACGKCVFPVEKTIIECGHKVELLCSEPPIHSLCKKACTKILSCGHRCNRLCGKPCDPNMCSIDVIVPLPCGHKKKVKCPEQNDPDALQCIESCGRQLPKCGHDCKNKCFEPCTEQCTVMVNKTWPCGHKLKRKCHQTQNPDEYPCNKPCSKLLPCGHKCTNKCSEDCTTKCKASIDVKCPRGHASKALCCASKDAVCDKVCGTTLACGHNCGGRCSDCHTTHIHAACKFSVKLKRFCRHTVTVNCLDLSDSHGDPRASKKCEMKCPHKKCSHDCSTTCEPCRVPCIWQCPHHKCDKQCYEICDRPPCNERCPNILKCGHQCFSICGEPCLTACPICMKRQFKKKLKKAKHFKEDELYIQLNCKHIFPVEFLDGYMSPKPTIAVPVGPKVCPECSQTMVASYRYGTAVKKAMNSVNSIKAKIQSEQRGHLTSETRQKTHERLSEIELAEEDIKQHSHFFERLSSKGRLLYEPCPQLTTTIKRFEDLLSGTAHIGPQLMYIISLFVTAMEMVDTIEKLPAVRYFSLEESEPNLLQQGINFLKRLEQEYNGPPQPSHKDPKRLLQEYRSPPLLSRQLVEDLKSEQYRLALSIEYAENSSTLTDQEPTKTLLQDLSRYSTQRLTRDVYETHSALLIRNSKSKDADLTHQCYDLVHDSPMVLKGHWFACSSKHLYSLPLCREPVHEQICLQCGTV